MKQTNSAASYAVEINEEFFNKNLVIRKLDHRHEIVLNRLRIGQTKLVHAHLISKSNSSKPNTNQPTVFVIVKLPTNTCSINCLKYNYSRNKYQIKGALGGNLYDKTQVSSVFPFLKGMLLFSDI